MEYLSTKQVSDIWGISPRRVVVLASEGRIEGAEQIDGRWFIPKGTKKPLPPVRAAKKCAEQDEKYLFPFPYALIHSENHIKKLSADEKALNDYYFAYESGDFEAARQQAEVLLNSDNPYVRIGALYQLPITCIFLGDYAATEKYYLLFCAECQSCREHKLELDLLYNELKLELFSISNFNKYIKSIDLAGLPEELIPLVSSYHLFVDMITEVEKKKIMDFNAYELICRMMESQGYTYLPMNMHIYLSLHYSLINNPQAERNHLKRAIDIGLKQKTYFTLAYSIMSNPTAIEILKGYPDWLSEKLNALATHYVKSKNGYFEYLKKSNIAENLNERDYALLYSCIKNHTIEQIAKILGISHSAVNKRLNHLYKKMNVSSKEELRREFVSFLIN